MGETYGSGNAEVTYVRKDIWSLPEDDPIVVGYANAVQAMQGRPDDDPTSWTYQAAMHGTYTTPALNLWNTCEHGMWFFLPWHRMYLYFFERIVRAAVVASGGPEDWALPYWNYTAAAGGNPVMPEAFRVNGPLFVPERRTAPYNVNNGDPLPGPVTSTTQALGTIPFVPVSVPITGFGGQTTGPVHFNGGFGAIEQQPHNVVHTAIGGPDGWMSDPNTAAQDPIFWLHHANIDRLWAEWIALGGGRENATDPGWLSQSFSFYDENGAEQSFTVAEVLDYTALGYTYDPEPGGAAGGLESLEAAEPIQATADPDAQRRPTELVGASSQSVQLTGGKHKGAVTVDNRARLESMGDQAAPRRVILTLDDIEGERDQGIVYGVYVNVPDGVTGDEAERYLAGPLSFFGLEGQGRRADGAEHVHSFSAGYDITKLVEDLSASGEWDEANVDVTFHPIGVPLDEEPQLESNTPPVTVGRISVHYG